MKDQELQYLWKQASSEPLIQIEPLNLSAGLEDHLHRFNKEIKKRNLKETLAGIVVFIFFAVLTYQLPYTLTKIGAALCATYGLVIIAIVNYIKRDTKEDFTLSLKDYLLSQKAYLSKERKLSTTVLYWYILPPTIGTLLFLAGLPLPNTAYIIMGLVIFLINTIIYFQNINIVKKTIDPLLLQVHQQISQLETKD